MDEAQWKGLWWLPEDPQDKRSGTLQCGPSGDLLLELFGGFDDDVWMPIAGGHSVRTGSGRFPIIHGICGSEEFTLLECQTTHTSGQLLGGITEQTISAISALRGILVQDAEAQVFTSMSMQIEFLLAWSQLTTMKATMQLDSDNRWTGAQTATSIPADELTAVYRESTFTLRVVHTRFRYEGTARSNDRSVVSREYADICVSTEEPSSLSGLSSTAKALQDLITFAAFRPAAILSRSLVYQAKPSEDGSGTGQSREVEMMGRMVYEPNDQLSYDRDNEFLFTLADVSFADVIPAWLAVYEIASLPCGMLFGTRYRPVGYTGMNTFMVASAAESLHRSLHDSTVMSDQEFHDAEQVVLRALSGDANRNARALIHEQFHNNLSFRQRLLELAQLPDKETVDRLLPNTDRWIKQLKNVRNGVAHGDNSRLVDGSDAVLSFRLGEISYAMLCLVLMAEIGIPAEAQRKALDNPSISHAMWAYAEISGARSESSS